MAIADIELLTATENANAQTELALIDALIVFARSKKMIAAFMLMAALAASIVSLVLPKWYTATAQIMPPQQTPSVAALLAGQLGGLAGAFSRDLGLKNPSDIYVTMLQSRTIADAIVHRFDLMKVYRDKRLSDARRDLEKASSIRPGNDGTISISVEDKDPRRAAAMANAYIDELRKLTQTVAASESSQRRLFFQNQLESEQQALTGAEIALKATEERTGMVHLEGQAKATIESVAKLRGLMAAKEVQLTAMRSFATAQNPDLVLAQQELSGLREQLVGMERRQGDLQVPTRQIPEAALEYVRRLRDVKYHESLFELLAKQYEAAKVDESKNATVIQVIDPATEPDKRSWPNRGLIVILTTIGAFLLGCSWALFRDYLARSDEIPESRARLQLLRSYLLH